VEGLVIIQDSVEEVLQQDLLEIMDMEEIKFANSLASKSCAPEYSSSPSL
jgi:hypothetical protein